MNNIKKCVTFNKVFLRYCHQHSKTKFPITVVSLQYVKYLGYPTCLDCKYFVPSIYDDESETGKCSKFATQELSSGKVNLEFAAVMRISDRYCGPNAKYKEIKKNDDCVEVKYQIPMPDLEKFGI